MYDVYYGKDGKSNDFMNLLDKKEIDVSDIQVFSLVDVELHPSFKKCIKSFCMHKT